MCFISQVNFAYGQSISHVVDSIVTLEKSEGATDVVFQTNACSGCNAMFQGYIFIKDNKEQYRVRCFQYLDENNKIKILHDTLLSTNEVSIIFKVLDVNLERLLYQIKNIEKILSNIHIENGALVGTPPPNHGKMRYVGIVTSVESARSIVSLLNVNDTFLKANEYWILNSAINNFIKDKLLWWECSHSGF